MGLSSLCLQTETISQKKDYNVLSTEASSRHDYFVETTLKNYQSLGLKPNGSPQWHLAHFPQPSHLGGKQVICLLEGDHAVQGVLQSEVYQTPCIYGWEGEYLDGELLALFKKWMAVKGRRVGKSNAGKPSASWHIRKDNWTEVSRLGGIASAVARRARGETSWGLNATPEEYAEKGRKGGKASASLRFQCPCCDMVANAGNLAKHMKATGHQGERKPC